MDLSDENLPPGSRLALGTAVLEVSDVPHTGCRKFAERYGTDATKFVNSSEGKRLHLRGINTRVVQAGTVRVGDVARKLA
jgi:MOSC domain-containing protein YiiM